MGPTKGSKRTFIVKAKGKPFNLEAFLAYGNGGTSVRKHRKGDTIFTQGDACDGVFYIGEGSCKITIVSEQGKEAVAALHEAALQPPTLLFCVDGKSGLRALHFLAPRSTAVYIQYDVRIGDWLGVIKTA